MKLGLCLTIGLSVLLLSACGGPPTPIPPMPTLTPPPTFPPFPTAAPSATPQPTNTSIPTKVEPTATRTQTPKPTVPPLSPTRAQPTTAPERSLEAEWSVRNLLVAPGQPGRLYAFLRKQVPVVTAADSRLLVSDDGGASWQPFAGGLPQCPAGRPIVTLNLDYANRDALYVSGCDGLYRWTGSQWERISSQVTLQVVVAFGQSNLMWAIAANSTDPIIRSDDGGKTWKPASTGLVYFGGMANLGFDPRDNKTLYGIISPRFAGSYLRRGKANGTWETMPTPGDAVIETGMTVDGATGALYVTAYDGARNTWQLWRSPNPNASDLKTVAWQPVYDFGTAAGRVQILASGWSPTGLAIYAQLPPTSCGSSAQNPCFWRVVGSNDGGKNWSTVVIK